MILRVGKTLIAATKVVSLKLRYQRRAAYYCGAPLSPGGIGASPHGKKKL
jgi:hypothetical protein